MGGQIMSVEQAGVISCLLELRKVTVTEVKGPHHRVTQQPGLNWHPGLCYWLPITFL